jgi:hypothetical protein
MYYRLTAYLFLLLFFPEISFSQQKFTEGTLRYKITITGTIPTPADEPTMPETQNGILTIQIKDELIRQDLLLEDGYSNTRISNYITDKGLVLQTINTMKYAIEVSLKERGKMNEKYNYGSLEPGKGKRSFGTVEGVEANYHLTDGSSLHFYYIADYELKYIDIFDGMPRIKGIPASFDMPMANGFSMHFELESILPHPVPHATFKVPEGYRIISKKEYEKLIR